MTQLKNILFSFIAIVLIPLLFFVAAELVLMGFGVGKSFNYFHEIEIKGEPHYQDNPEFAHQFYAPSLSIGPIQNTFTEERGPDLVRVYVMGGSAAMGFPHKNHGVDRLLATQLRAAMPSKKIEVINTAMTSVNSHVVYAVANSIPKNSADFAVILMGNNEVVGPYGPGTFIQNYMGNITLIRGLQALKRTRIWQALDGLILKIRPTDAKEDLEWEGMQMFTNHGVSYDDPRMESVYSHYEDNLTDIIETLQDKGMHVLLSSVPVNLRNSAPFLSVHQAGLSDGQLNQWRELMTAGSISAGQKRWADAVTNFEAAIEIDPDYADAYFRLATAYENLDELEKAKSHYERALDLDALRFRADTRINQIVKDVAASIEDDDFSFVDSAAAFEQTSEPYQPGWNLLLEHVHYDFSGNHVLAAEFSRSIVNSLSPSADYQPLSSNQVAARIGFPNHETIEVIKNLQGMVEHPPFPGQSNYSELNRFLDERLAGVIEEVGSPADVIERRRDVLNAGLVDWKVHFELAALSKNMRNPQSMYFHLNKLFELYPHNRESYMNIAEAMSKDGKWREVIPYLEESLYYTRGDERKIAESIGWLGVAYFRTGEYDKARDLLLELTDKYSGQTDLTLRAYGNLIRNARQKGRDKELERYARDVQRYGEKVVRSGRAAEYPMFYTRMSQIMTLGGYTEEAKEWEEAQPK